MSHTKRTPPIKFNTASPPTVPDGTVCFDIDLDFPVIKTPGGFIPVDDKLGETVGSGYTPSIVVYTSGVYDEVYGDIPDGWKQNQTTIIRLSIGTTCTHIGDNAFEGCTGLKQQIIFPESVTSIGNSAFKGCTGFFGQLVIPDDITTIGDFAFANIDWKRDEIPGTSLSGLGYNCLRIGRGVTSIGMNAFSVTDSTHGFDIILFAGEVPPTIHDIAGDGTTASFYKQDCANSNHGNEFLVRSQSEGTRDLFDAEFLIERGYIFWIDVNNSRIMRAPVAGGSSEIVHTDTSGMRGLFYEKKFSNDPAYLYWANQVNETFNRVGIDGSNPEVLFTINTASAVGMVVIGDDIYWADNADQTIKKHAINDIFFLGEQLVYTIPQTPAATIVQGLVYKQTLDENNFVVESLYWSGRGTTTGATIGVVETDGSNGATLLTGTDSKYLSVTDDYIYFSHITDDKISRCDLDGSNLTDIITTGLILVESVYVTNIHPAIPYAKNYIYWADSGTRLIERCELDGSNRVTLLDITTGTLSASLSQLIVGDEFAISSEKFNGADGVNLIPTCIPEPGLPSFYFQSGDLQKNRGVFYELNQDTDAVTV